ncbi:MAG: glycosyltransferase family 4 protein [Candidatus Bathyarchaeota archaeon]|nr:glycosyltransferase family 4 protein [Candidatus Bathyarchaeota archaeon]
MRILMLSWEYPPRIVGGISRHVYFLSRALASEGCEVHVVTLDFPGKPVYEVEDNVHIHRIPVEIGAPNFYMWVALFNHFFEKRIGYIAYNFGKPDIVHSHDWLTALSGISAKHMLRVPFIATFHSTERGRSQGLTTPESYMIDSIEWWASYEASIVLTVSSHMRDELIRWFKLPEDKVYVIYNGVDPAAFDISVDRDSIRGRLGVKPWEKLIVSVGRMSYQKGFHILLQAMSTVIRRHREVKLILVGDGYMRRELERQASDLGLSEYVIFTGFVDDDHLKAILRSADIMVVCSLYEPFGIVALEGMASGLPLIVSATGGLKEIVEHEVDGLWAYPGDPNSLASCIERLLVDTNLASKLRWNAIVKAKRFDWRNIARKVLEAYGEAGRRARFQ